MIRNRSELARTPAREVALSCLSVGIEAARPAPAVRSSVAAEDGTLTVCGTEYDLDDADSVVVLGGGKAAARMARGLEDRLGEALDGGVVVTDDPVGTDRVTIRGASHPVPDERGIEGARTVLRTADSLGPSDLALVVLTGGASALLPAPAEGIDLGDLRAVTEALLASGAPIEAVNAVRKHCSAIKGGRLARTLAPATVHTLAVSDVVGDDPSVIGSGPTVGDSSTYRTALDVIERQGVEAPESVVDHLSAGARGDWPETPAPGDPAVAGVTYDVLVTNRTAVRAARGAAEDLGYDTVVLSTRIRGEAAEVGRVHAAVGESVLAAGDPLDPPAVVVSGGETTVTVTGDGTGGPNTTTALAGALAFAEGPSLPDGGGIGSAVALGAVDTDGRDGPGAWTEPPAGALVDGDTVVDPGAAAAALSNDDAHTYLRERGDLVYTGPTGTNVNDLRVIVVPDA